MCVIVHGRILPSSSCFSNFNYREKRICVKKEGTGATSGARFFSSSNFYTIRQIHFEKNSQSCKAIEQTVPETNAKKKSPWDRICSQYIE